MDTFIHIYDLGISSFKSQNNFVCQFLTPTVLPGFSKLIESKVGKFRQFDIGKSGQSWYLCLSHMQVGIFM